ncbi:hydroxyneurosporene dehydrogenase [Chondromyces apiculatus]|uniref:Hydroxyneurosporene synthase n=1 Tax=Chondromyces apiculatus DSM 436 TaxID=1192034 RepID=A0A017T3F6_9BACT|nr:hydroxyneurosporene dehydrogenase [Chondromyces apiculatus]EYF03789.1 hydroxyneurosporene synthase [Chondromyces apiculatus DSM 436]
MSDDGRHAVTIIALLGSVFSPYYVAARGRDAGEPLDHCAMNVALYGPGRSQWALTERRKHTIERGPDALVIGPSVMEWRDGDLLVSFDETTSHFPSLLQNRLRGQVRLMLRSAPPAPIHLDAAGRHTWAPIAPIARAEVTLSHPQLRFSGSAYLDSNAGEEPLEAGFTGWNWARAAPGTHDGSGRTRSTERAEVSVSYGVTRRDGSHMLVARAFDTQGESREISARSTRPFGRTGWGLSRTLAVDPGTAPRLVRTLEDTPFYARSLAEASLGGQQGIVVHEQLSLERFAQPWVRLLIPFRMRRTR